MPKLILRQLSVFKIKMNQIFVSFNKMCQISNYFLRILKFLLCTMFFFLMFHFQSVFFNTYQIIIIQIWIYCTMFLFSFFLNENLFFFYSLFFIKKCSNTFFLTWLEVNKLRHFISIVYIWLTTWTSRQLVPTKI